MLDSVGLSLNLLKIIIHHVATLMLASSEQAFIYIYGNTNNLGQLIHKNTVRNMVFSCSDIDTADP